MSDFDNLISRTEALEITKRCLGDYATAFSEIRRLPAIDAEPVIHGHWDVVTVGTNFHTDRLCRNCKKTIKSNYWCYCPNCGAKMDEVSE